MYIWTLSSLILVVAAGVILSMRDVGVELSKDSQLEISSTSVRNEIQDSVTLDDLPPPDDTYTPDQRRYS